MRQEILNRVFFLSSRSRSQNGCYNRGIGSVSRSGGAGTACPRRIDRAWVSGHAVGMNSQGRDRPDWDTYFMDIAHVVARRGNCSRRQVAAILVSDRRIFSTGYNGTPRGIRNCFEGGCPRCAGEAPSGTALTECICSHAEENAVTQAAYHGISVRDATLYCTLSPCLLCARMIINAGIREVVYEEEYEFNAQTRALLKEAGVECRQFKRSSS